MALSEIDGCGLQLCRRNRIAQSSCDPRAESLGPIDVDDFTGDAQCVREGLACRDGASERAMTEWVVDEGTILGREPINWRHGCNAVLLTGQKMEQHTFKVYVNIATKSPNQTTFRNLLCYVPSQG